MLPLFLRCDAAFFPDKVQYQVLLETEVGEASEELAELRLAVIASTLNHLTCPSEYSDHDERPGSKII